MAVPKYDELMKPLLAAVKDGEVYKIKDVTAVLAQQLNLSAEDLTEMLPSGRQTVFKNRVGWAKTYLKKAGLLDSPARATIVITEASNPVPTPLLGHRCRSSQEITGSPTPFSTSNHYLWICPRASFSLSNPNIAA